MISAFLSIRCRSPQNLNLLVSSSSSSSCYCKPPCAFSPGKLAADGVAAQFSVVAGAGALVCFSLSEYIAPPCTPSSLLTRFILKVICFYYYRPSSPALQPLDPSRVGCRFPPLSYRPRVADWRIVNEKIEAAVYVIPRF